MGDVHDIQDNIVWNMTQASTHYNNVILGMMASQITSLTITNANADVTIHVGTNDCSTKFPVDKIADNIREISNQAKRVSRSGCVTFSSITPRIDNVAAAENDIEYWLSREYI